MSENCGSLFTVGAWHENIRHVLHKASYHYKTDDFQPILCVEQRFVSHEMLYLIICMDKDKEFIEHMEKSMDLVSE